MQALIILQPFKIHTRFIGIFDDNHNPEMIRAWLANHLAHFKLDNRPEVSIVKHEHWTEELIRTISYSIIYAEGFIQLYLVPLKMNELCDG